MDDVKSCVKGDVRTEDNLVLVMDTMDVVDSPPEASETVCDTESLFSCTSDLFEGESCEGDLDSSSVSLLMMIYLMIICLRRWKKLVRQHNISSSAVNTLLHILHAYHMALL